MATYTVKSRIDRNTIYVETFDEAGKSIPDATIKFASYAKTPEDQNREIADAEKFVRDVIDATGAPPKKSEFQKQTEATDAMLGSAYQKSVRDVIDATGAPPKKSEFQKQTKATDVMLGSANQTTYTYEYEVVLLGDGSTKNFYLYEIGHNQNKGIWENELYSETPIAGTSPEAAKERGIIEILKDGEDAISGAVEDLKNAGDRNKKSEPTPAKLAESVTTKNDPALVNKEPYVTSGNSSTEAGVNQITESLKDKPESASVTVNVNVPASEKSTDTITEKINTVTEIKPGEEIKSTPASIIADQAEKAKVEEKHGEAKVVQNAQTVPVKDEKKEEGQSTAVDIPLRVEAAIIKYNIEHGLNPDGSAKVDKSNPGNSSPAASSLAAIGDKEAPQDKSVRVVQSSDDNFKLTDYQEAQGIAALEKKISTIPGDKSKALAPTGDVGNSQSYITTPGSVVKTAAEPPAKTQQELDLEESEELLIKLNKLIEVGWLSTGEPTKPGEMGNAVEDKEKAKEEIAADKPEAAKTVVNAPITTDLIKNPESGKSATPQAGTPYDPSKGKKDLLTKITEEREKDKTELAATAKTARTERQDHQVENLEPKGLSEVKVKTAETKLTPEISRGIMQNSPESKRLDVVNESLGKVQSSLLTIGQTQTTNANNSNTINNTSSLVRNEDNRKIGQEEKKEERPAEKKDEKAASQQNSNQLTDFYLHGIYDALVSQGIKIKSY